MKALLVLAVAAPALAFTGCTRVEKERVVEKPVVEKETVVKAPADSPVVVERQVAVTPRSCTYGSSAYSSGSISCQSSQQYRCEDGIWRAINTAC